MHWEDVEEILEQKISRVDELASEVAAIGGEEERKISKKTEWPKLNDKYLSTPKI